MTFNPYIPRPIDRPTAVPLAPDADLSILDEAKIFAAPDNPADRPAWRAAIARWRVEARAKVGYSDARYADTRHTARVMNIAWLWDDLLYDHEAGRFTVDRYLDAAEKQFGGFDGVTLWNGYPVLGIDSRNHFDFTRGVPDLPEVVAEFQRRGVRVYFSYYPWETGKGPEAIGQVIDLVVGLGVDGVFLDSSREASPALREALDAIDPTLTVESESKVPLARVAHQQMSWAQWFADSDTPGVLRTKWLERRHELHYVRRWHRDHLDELHSAWLNGTGIVVWEVVFGVWVGWNSRDSATLRAMQQVYRSHADWFTSEDWIPLADTAAPQLVASRWIHDGVPMWTVVNRGGDYHGPWLPDDTGLVDLISGSPAGGSLPAGAVAAVTAGTPFAGKPIVGTPTFPQRIPIRIAAPVVLRNAPPPGMVAVDWPGGDLTVSYRLRETGLYGEAPFIDEWKPLPPRLHASTTLTRHVPPRRFAIARHETTVLEFQRFAEPAGGNVMSHNWSALPDPARAHLATDLALREIRSWAAAAGARLPTEDEWQIAMQLGLLSRAERQVWEYTESEHRDGRSRFVILKGGTSQSADPHFDWYLESGPFPPAYSVKLVMCGDRVARSRLIGFRCAVDLA